MIDHNKKVLNEWISWFGEGGFETASAPPLLNSRQFVIAADRRIEGFAIIANFAAESVSVGLMVMGGGDRDYPQMEQLNPFSWSPLILVWEDIGIALHIRI